MLIDHDDILDNIWHHQARHRPDDLVSFIRTFRAATGLGRREAKIAVEDYYIKLALAASDEERADLVKHARAIVRGHDATQP